MDVDASPRPPAESSAQALKRLSLLQPPTWRAPDPAAFHPRSSAFVYAPTTPSACRVTSTFTARPPAPVPFPPVPTTSYNATASPDGAWVTTYMTSALPTSPPDSGCLFVFAASAVLSPASTPTSAMPLAHFILPSPPLDLVYLYPPRTATSRGRARPRGPRSPPSYTSAYGPSLLVLTCDMLYLIYPRPVMPPADSSFAGYDQMSCMLSMLRVPIDVAARVDAASPTPRPSARIDRGWMRMVGGDRGVWVTMQAGDRVDAMRVDVKADLDGGLAVETAILPMTRTSDSLASVVFFSPYSQEPTTAQDVHAALVYNLSGTPGSQDYDDRTRIDWYTMHWGAVDIASSFAEIGSGEAGPRLHRWSVMPKGSKIFPPGGRIVAVDPLPDVWPYTWCTALLSGPSGYTLAHLNIENGTVRLSGARKVLDLDATDVAIISSPSMHRGSVGLVAVVGDSLRGVTFLPGPSLSADEVSRQAADAIILAMSQGDDWSDCMRHAFAQAEDATGMADAVIGHAFDRLRARGHVLNVAQVQVAAWSLANDPRHVYALDLVRMIEICRLFRLATLRPGAFETNTVWFLLDIFDWSVVALGQLLRDAILGKTRRDWATSSDDLFADPSRSVFLVHPQLRSLVSDLISHLEAFASFVRELDRPILPVGSVEKDARGTLVGRVRLDDTLAREGVDLAAWRGALGALDGLTAGFTEQDLDAALRMLGAAPLGSAAVAVLDALPSPSTLFMAPPAEPVDGVTFAPLDSGPHASCDRCRSRTQLAAGPGLMRGEVASPWTAWVRLWSVTCMCGGTWYRERP